MTTDSTILAFINQQNRTSLWVSLTLFILRRMQGLAHNNMRRFKHTQEAKE